MCIGGHCRKLKSVIKKGGAVSFSHKKMLKSDFLLTLLKKNSIFFIGERLYFKELFHAVLQVSSHITSVEERVRFQEFIVGKPVPLTLFML